MNLRPWSKSRLGVAYKCAWKAFAIYVLELGRHIGKAGQIGINIHYLLRMFLMGASFEEVAETAQDYWTYRLAVKAFGGFPLRREQISGTEVKFHFDEKGRVPKHPKDIWYTGVIDALEINRDQITIIEFKSGFDESDNPIEREGYVVGIRAYFPMVKRIIFIRYFVQTGHWDTWIYTWKLLWLKVEHVGEGSAILPKSRPLEILQAAIAGIERIDPIPNTGDHCVNWYGEQCEFLGTECPASIDKRFLYTLVTETNTLINHDVASFPSFPEGEKPGRAAIMIKEGLPISDITPEIANYALQGVQQLRGGASMISKILREWSKENGPIMVGDTAYGWKPKKIIDEFLALKLMAGKVLLEDLARIISISHTGLKKVSKRKYGDLRESLLIKCVKDSEDETFGVLPDKLNKIDVRAMQ